MIPFAEIPSSLRIPLFFAEVSNALANNGGFNQRALIIGGMNASGASGVANVPILCQGVANAKALGGPGSSLALMADAYRKNDSLGEFWLLPLTEAGTAATGSLAFTAPATANGTLSLYIAGQLVSLAVSSTQTADQLATALAAAINAVTDLPVTAAVDGVTLSKVDITAKSASAIGNDIDIRVNYQGEIAGEVTPAGLTFTITAMSGGLTNPTLTTALANCGDTPFDFIICPYTDATSLDAIKAFLNDQTGRWSWDVQVYGHCFYAYRGTVSALATFGNGRNDQHASCMGFNDSPSPNFVWAAAYAGAAAVSLKADPGRPCQTLVINGVLAPPLASRFVRTDRNTLLFDGISTFTVAQDGTVAIENLITTYQKNSFNQPDSSYLEVETMFLLMFILRDLAVMVTSKYARMKLAQDGSRFAPGSAIVTPSSVRADLIAEYQKLEFEGMVQNSTAFAAALVVEINANNPNRLDVLFVPTLIGQLRVFALLAQFRLQ